MAAETAETARDRAGRRSGGDRLADAGAAAEVSRELREGTDRALQHRRWIAGLSLLSTAALGYVGLYQMGVIRKLPDLPLPRFHANEIHASAEGYGTLRTPDALLGAVSYGVTACLAGAGGECRAGNAPLLPLAMGAKIALDLALAAGLSGMAWKKFRGFSSWSLLVAGVSATNALLARREALMAFRTLLEERKAIG